MQQVFSNLKSINLNTNKIKAFELYKEAAKIGIIESIYQLGEFYYYGIGTNL
jgi:TPR repeat protein